MADEAEGRVPGPVMPPMRIVLALLLSLGTGLHAPVSSFRAPLRAATAIVAGQASTRTPDVHFVPTPTAIVDAMLKLAKVTASDVVYDLGSGDGRIVIAAAQKFGARGVGIELNSQLVNEANKKARKAGVADKVTFLSVDFFKADISEATVVTLYLLPSINLRLQPKLMRELKPGARIVSHRFDMGAWRPEQELVVRGAHVFLWTIPDRQAP